MKRSLAILCAAIFGASWAVGYPALIHADEVATSASGRKVLLKDDGSWTYADKVPNENMHNNGTADQTIRTHCLSEWIDDFQMRSYCEKQQRAAVQALAMGKPDDVSQEEFVSVRRHCAAEWPDDFQMREYCEKQQFSAIRELKRH